MTYAEIVRDALSIAAAIRGVCAPGDRVMFLFPPGLDYIRAFLGCMFGRVLAVPSYPPDVAGASRSYEKVSAIVRDCEPRLLLTSASLLSTVQAFANEDPFAKVARPIVSTLEALVPMANFEFSLPENDEVAFLQYTSGSTGQPKGTMLSHGNLGWMLQSIQDHFCAQPGERLVSWLPPYHDMGLIGGILGPLYACTEATLMAPLTFLRRPLLWLEVISKKRAHISVAPNFAYQLCADRAKPEDVARLDLSEWRLAACGAEPVRGSTLDGFLEKFAPARLRPTVFFPCYGLAEDTLMTACAKANQGHRRTGFEPAQLSRGVVEAREDAPPLVSCGAPTLGTRLAIVESETRRELPADRVGEIWVQNAAVARGYWRNESATVSTFGNFLGSGEGPFLNTGDIGFLHGGELYVCGRSKDLIIVRGKNIYPQDVERLAESTHPALRSGCSVALPSTRDDVEGIVLALEIDRRYRPDRRANEVPGAPLPRGAEKRTGAERRAQNAADEAASRTLEERAAAHSAESDQADGLKYEEIAKRVATQVGVEFGVDVFAIWFLKPGDLPKTSSGKIQRAATRALVEAGKLGAIFEWSRPAAVVLESLRPEAFVRASFFAQLTPIERFDKVRSLLVQDVARALKVAPSSLEKDAPLMTLGMTSLAGAELRTRIERSTGVLLASTAPYNYPTIDALAEHIAERIMALGASAGPAAEPASVEIDPRINDATRSSFGTALERELELARRSLMDDDDE